MRIRLVAALPPLALVLSVACSSSPTGFAGADPNNPPELVSPNNPDEPPPDLGGGGGGGGSVPTPTSNCQYRDNIDHDGDGYSFADGDCNDCDPNANPGAFDVPGNGRDEDCSGTPDDEPTSCDDGIALDTTDANAAARAIGLCRVGVSATATGKARTWGVLSAKFVKADGKSGMNAKSHGVMAGFGAANVQDGKRLLALSSGTARLPGQPGFQALSGANMGNTCDAPIPNISTPSCPGVKSGEPYNSAALEVQIRVPTNANSFSFSVNFYTFEFPVFVCSKWNDFYVTLMSPKPAGSTNGNISFDQDKNAIGVNNSMLQVCEPQYAGGKNFKCPLGTALLDGTGFDEADENYQGPHAATGWLRTQSPVKPGSVVTLRFAIWDAGDARLDSTVLIDNFKWDVGEAKEATTEPVANPK